MHSASCAFQASIATVARCQPIQTFPALRVPPHNAQVACNGTLVSQFHPVALFPLPWLELNSFPRTPLESVDTARASFETAHSTTKAHPVLQTASETPTRKDLL